MIDNTIVLGGGGTNDIVEWLEENALQKVPMTFTNSGSSAVEITKSFQVPDLSPSKPEKWILIVSDPAAGGARALYIAATSTFLLGVGTEITAYGVKLSGSMSGTTGTVSVTASVMPYGSNTYTAYVVTQAGTFS